MRSLVHRRPVVVLPAPRSSPETLVEVRAADHADLPAAPALPARPLPSHVARRELAFLALRSPHH